MKETHLMSEEDMIWTQMLLLPLSTGQCWLWYGLLYRIAWHRMTNEWWNVCYTDTWYEGTLCWCHCVSQKLYMLKGEQHKLWYGNIRLNEWQDEVTQWTLVSHVARQAVALGSFISLFSFLTWDTENRLQWCLTTPMLDCWCPGEKAGTQEHAVCRD